MHPALSLVFADFDSEDNPIQLFQKHNQTKYIKSYLQSLGAQKVLVEPNYFDRDYLSEFSAFYSLSSRGYPNICKRVHFFSSHTLNQELLRSALAGDEVSKNSLQETYLGFAVIRPLPFSPFGRTVLKWFDDTNGSKPRITAPSRNYHCNVGGITLTVTGLAWQQQDSGVAACATVSVWSMLHSSAFDDVHAIPTTAQITEAAHKTASSGSRVFPSNFLTITQLLEAIKGHGFAPVASTGELEGGYFSKKRFSATCSAFLRSGYPVLIMGMHNEPDAAIGHAICGVGFREPEPVDTEPEQVNLFDGNTGIIYIHDDNIGPNVRFKIEEKQDHTGKIGAVLMHEAPAYLDPANRPEIAYPEIFPHTIIAAVHEDLRISPDNLHAQGKQLTHQICKVINAAYSANSLPLTGLLFSARFIKLAKYFQEELANVLSSTPAILADTRLSLMQNVPPMSLHIGVIRIAHPNGIILLDILYDTTDTDRNKAVYAHVMYDKDIDDSLNAVPADERANALGVPVKAY